MRVEIGAVVDRAADRGSKGRRGSGGAGHFGTPHDAAERIAASHNMRSMGWERGRWVGSESLFGAFEKSAMWRAISAGCSQLGLWPSSREDWPFACGNALSSAAWCSAGNKGSLPPDRIKHRRLDVGRVAADRDRGELAHHAAPDVAGDGHIFGADRFGEDGVDRGRLVGRVPVAHELAVGIERPFEGIDAVVEPVAALDRDRGGRADEADRAIRGRDIRRPWRSRPSSRANGRRRRRARRPMASRNSLASKANWLVE